MFIYPVSESEARNQTRSAETVFLSNDRQYKYKNDTLIDLLDITQEEQKSMTTIIGTLEYKRRNNEYNKLKYKKNNVYDKKLKKEGKRRKKEAIEERRQKIKSLIQQGFKQSYILSTLNITRDMYIKDKRYLKNKGLL